MLLEKMLTESKRSQVETEQLIQIRLSDIGELESQVRGLRSSYEEAVAQQNQLFNEIVEEQERYRQRVASIKSKLESEIKSIEEDFQRKEQAIAPLTQTMGNVTIVVALRLTAMQALARSIMMSSCVSLRSCGHLTSNIFSVSNITTSCS